MPAPQEISINLPVRTVAEPEWLAGRASADTVVGERYCTVILPLYSPVYQQALRALMRGIVLSEAQETTDDSGKAVVASIFGFVEKTPIRYLRGDTTAIIPSMGRRFVSMVSDPVTALDNYHERLITTTNIHLEVLGAGYRLAPLERRG